MEMTVIGAGLAGLATTWNLINSGTQVTVYDAAGVGGGASGLAAGLLHPYSGASANLNRYGHEGIAAAEELLQVAGEEVVKRTGVIRVAITEKQREDFRRCAETYDDVEWLGRVDVPGVADAPGILIKSGMTVNTGAYLQRLWEACEKKGAVLKREQIDTVDEETPTIVAAGAASKDFVDLPLRQTKGQILILEWPQNLPPLPCGINSKAYVVMLPDGKRCLAGSTFEREFTHTEPTEAGAAEIMEKVIAFFPGLEGAKILEHHAGVRAVAPNHLPLVQQVKEKCWVITGMGSKGLLYHALYARNLLEALKF